MSNSTNEITAEKKVNSPQVTGHCKRSDYPEQDRVERLRIKGVRLATVFAPVLYACIAFLVVFAVTRSGTWPAGDDVMYHIYRGEKVFEAVSKGHLWIPLDTDWYNGVEILRYWSPLPAYFMALCQWLAGGNALHGYLVFTWIVYMISAMDWYLIGLRRKRPYMGLVLGVLWFFVPQNLMYYFESGNLAGMLGIACVLPWMICFLAEYVETPNARRLLGLSLSTALMALCHSGFALLVMLTMLLWLVIRKLLNWRESENTGRAILAVILGFLLTGVWFLASRHGVSSVDYSEQLKASFQSILYTLNPFDRKSNGFAHYYFGLAAFGAAVFGMLFARKKSKARAGFITAILVCLLTTTAAYALIHVLPGGSFFWTSRMISAAIAIFFFSMLEWKSLRVPLQILIAVLLAADSIPSAALIYGHADSVSTESRWEAEQNATLLKEAKSITQQRLALIDASSLASTGAYLASSWKSQTETSFGAGYEAAVTRKNITMLNRAVRDGYYPYFFDRALELGNDTIVIQIAQLQNGSLDLQAVEKAAKQSGYQLTDSNNEYLLYHRNTDKTFGVVSEYRAIAIGKNASEIAEQYPVFKEADNTDLSSYSYQELSGYQVICLDGFTMSDRDYAEKLIRKLAKHGVRIVVEADGIPEDRSSRQQEFLGVTCHPIKFENGYPQLNTMQGQLNPQLFPEGSEQWNTVYLTGLDHVWGSIEDDGLTLDFMGTAEDDNIVFIGLNLSYFEGMTKDTQVSGLLTAAMQVSGDEIPDRRLVSLKIRETANSLTITSPENDVNTTLAYHDIFTSDQSIWGEHNLTYVKKGRTVIRYRNPYLAQGLAVTFAAAAGLVVMVYREKRRRGKRKNIREKL